MSIRFFDYDDVTNSDIIIEGKAFEVLLDLCFRYSKYVSFLTTETDFKKYPNLNSFLVDEKNMLFEVYNKHLCYSDNASVSFFYCTKECQNVILRISKNLWAFIHGWGFSNPEDPTFYRYDGSVFFSSQIHEGYGTFYPRKGEDISAFFEAVDFHTKINTIQIVEDQHR